MNHCWGPSLPALAGEPVPQPRMDIRMIKDILRLNYSGGLSHEAIARSLGCSKGVVAKYLSLAGVAGLDWHSQSPQLRAFFQLLQHGRSAGRCLVPHIGAQPLEHDRADRSAAPAVTRYGLGHRLGGLRRARPSSRSKA